jgi:very-short-patch-repair endonuclease
MAAEDPLKHLTLKRTIFNGVTYYKANDLAFCLGYVNYKKAASTHIPPEFLFQASDIAARGNGNGMRARYTTSTGATFLVHRSRLPNSIDVAEALGIPLSPRFKAYYHEMNATRCFLKAFKGPDIRRQFGVGEYHIDVLFAEYNIAVECDEKDHPWYDKVKDAARSAYIDEAIGCKWVRFNPDAKDFDILDVINRIHMIIVKRS